MYHYLKGARHNPIIFNGSNYERSDIYIFEDCGVTIVKVMPTLNSFSHYSVSILCNDDFLGMARAYYSKRFGEREFNQFHTDMLLTNSSDDMYKILKKYNFK